jgi:hypothetical protein
MIKMRRTRIADIAVAGHELAEEHLRLAAGGCFDPISNFCPTEFVTITRKGKEDVGHDSPGVY